METEKKKIAATGLIETRVQGGTTLVSYWSVNTTDILFSQNNTELHDLHDCPVWKQLEPAPTIRLKSEEWRLTDPEGAKPQWINTG